MARKGKAAGDAPNDDPGSAGSAQISLFYQSRLTVPRNPFVTPAAAFAAYLLGSVLLFSNRGVAAFILLSFALTIHIFDAYTFPFLNRLSGRKESLLFGGAGKYRVSEIPSAIIFLSASPENTARKRRRSLYRIGFLGGVILFFTSVATLLKISAPHIFPAAGAALSAAGFFSRGLHEEEKNGSALSLEAFSPVAERLIRDDRFGSWILLLTDQWPQTMAFLARYRRHILSCPLFFLSFDEGLPEKECAVHRSLALLTGYRTHPGLTAGLVRIAAEKGLAVTSRENGLVLNCLCALARGYRAASITVSSRIDEGVLLDSLRKINRLQYMRGESR